MNPLDHNTLDGFVKQWSEEKQKLTGGDNDETFEEIYQQILFMTEHAYSGYIPARYSRHSPILEDRMVEWLKNDGLTGKDQIALFQLLPRLSYFSFDDFIGLYRTAYTNQISQWVWEQVGLSMDEPGYSLKLEKERSRHTWYASVTDSLIISEFYHINAIDGIKIRPNFQTIYEFSPPSAVVDYMRNRRLKRLVLLEDFVGCGEQAHKIVEWAVKHLQVSVLFCPMLICPDGFKRFSELAATSNGLLKVDPIIKLGDSAFLNTRDKSDKMMGYIAELSNRIHPHVADNNSENEPPYGPNGFCQDSDSHKGATVVLFSNTPDNTLPLVHFDGTGTSKSNWSPVFPRVIRELA